MLTRPAERAGRLNEAMVDTSRIMLLGLIMDGIYQYIEFDTFHPAEAVAITLVLAFLPYVVLRELVARVATPVGRPRRREGRSVMRRTIECR